MHKRFAVGVGMALIMLPVFAAADTVPGDSPPLVSLYTQLIQLLQKEIELLQNPPAPSITLSTPYGPAPLTVVFVLHNPTYTEAIDFGDGHSTGSNGCTKNALGWCDLTQPILHVYQYPAQYLVTLFRHIDQKTTIQSTTTVTVVASI